MENTFGEAILRSLENFPGGATANEIYKNIVSRGYYAFGDGMNDKEMLEYVNVGIAVGNAKEGLKAVADEVTDDITNDGIYNAMKRHNLI